MSLAPLQVLLLRLLDKYRTLADLRARREEAERAGMTEFGAGEAAERTTEFRRIAREFPGSLREIEISPSGILEAKAREVQEEIEEIGHDPGRARPRREWIAIVLDYHATLREALAIKRWLAQHRRSDGLVTPDMAGEFVRWHGLSPLRHSAVGPDPQSFLEEYRRPPGGRLHSLVWRALEGRHGLRRLQLERAVFGPVVDGTRQGF
jgi:hypothetical protein